MKTKTLTEKFSRKTKRLEIRFFQRKDFPAWRDAYLKSGKQRNRWDQKKRDPKTLTREDFFKIVSAGRERRKRGVFFDFIAIDRKTGDYVGLASLMEISRGVFQNAYFGYFLFNTHWGKGYAREICEAVIDIGFRDLKLHRIEAGIEPSNLRSIRLARRLGMRKEGLSKRRLYLDKKWRDIVCYALTSEERGIRHPGGQKLGNRR